MSEPITPTPLPSEAVERLPVPIATRLLAPPPWRVSRWLFLRLLALAYFFAFWSFLLQAPGLIGSQGINPAAPFLDLVHQRLQGPALWRLPTIFWLGASDTAIATACWTGLAASLFALAGVLAWPAFLACFVLYLSLSAVSGVFMGYQWDGLLLECGFIALLLTPLQVLPAPEREPPTPRSALWLVRFLAFRLMLSAGIVKLASGDPTWRDLTALLYHYETQPLPQWTAWYAAKLPALFQQASVAATLVIELLLPFALLTPRKLRAWVVAGLLLLQVLIMVTGNYAFFNILTCALCLAWLDDDHLPRWLHRLASASRAHRFAAAFPFPRPIRLLAASLVALLSIDPLLSLVDMTFKLNAGLPPGILQVDAALRPFQIVNHYGLFAVMTTRRDEISVEGSDDGVTWKPYVFRHKPGDPHRRPDCIAPFQPRLDWQMWFASLGTFQQNRWFANFCVRLLEGSKPVLALLDSNPFPDRPPRYVRSTITRYRYTTWDEARATGDWWHPMPETTRVYSPVMSLGQ